MVIPFTHLQVFGLQHGDDIVLRPYGILNVQTYRHFRDALLKATFESPRSVIINVADLTVATSACWSVFSRVSWQVSVWPAVPVLLVAAQDAARKAITASGITRYVPVFDTEAQAMQAVATGNAHRRRRAHIQLPALTDYRPHLRLFITETLNSWNQADHCDAVIELATSLAGIAEQAVPNSGGSILRVETDDVRLFAAVTRYRLPSAADTSATPSPVYAAQLAQLGRTHGLTETADRTTLWAVHHI